MRGVAASNQLIVFVKAPRPGLVKTRLAAVMGPAAAAAAYRSLAETLFSRLPTTADVELKFTPADAAAEILPWIRPKWRLSPQSAGGLGDRMSNAFADAFARGAKRVVIIGSDCPYLDSGDLDEAYNLLQDHDVVLGPAGDGGYWLIGLQRPQPSLFQSIPWSTETVLSATLAAADHWGLRVGRLRELDDIDTAEDYRRFAEWRTRGTRT
jgi:rSAM/selenodomain-associated transferase 1